MTTKQGDLALLNDPVAQELLNGPYTVHLAYVWKDGTPRVIPIGMHWDGKQLVTGTFESMPKMKVIEEGTPVAVTIDSYAFPYHVLNMRGIAHVEVYDGIVPEWNLAGEKLAGKEVAAQFAGMAEGMLNVGALKMVRLAIEPTWVSIQDFTTRFPNELERGMESLSAAGAQAA